MNGQLLAALVAVDTPTIVNAIEVAKGSRDFDRFTRSQVYPTDPAAPPIAGRAVTARIRAAAPPNESPEVTAARRDGYYRYLAQADQPAVLVIEDLDHPDCVGAWWGEVHAALHKALGLSGAVTNGLVRDLDCLAPDFPILAGAVGVSHAHVHVVDFGKPVRVFGMKVSPGEVVHADRHGATVIPEALLQLMPEAIVRMQKAEQIVLSQFRSGQSLDVDALADSWAAYREALRSPSSSG
ncbi:MAG: RraA family protein [Rhodobacteraceae bacterium]|nr:RraA family protein [Paracoccaceae bacterium]